MKNDNLLDQFFLADQSVAQDLVLAGEVNKKDTVLEIGAGKGFLTKFLTEKAKKVIAIEIDSDYKKDLQAISGNLQIIIGNALEIMKLKNKNLYFNKIIGSLPSSIVEPLIKILFKLAFESAVFLVPLKFAYKMTAKEPYLIYFETKILKKIDKKKFHPSPKTNWALVVIKKKNEADEQKNLETFLKRYCFEHPKAKKNNALCEGLIRYYKKSGKKLTKNQARALIKTKNPPFSV